MPTPTSPATATAIVIADAQRGKIHLRCGAVKIGEYLDTDGVQAAKDLCLALSGKCHDFMVMGSSSLNHPEEAGLTRASIDAFLGTVQTTLGAEDDDPYWSPNLPLTDDVVVQRQRLQRAYGNLASEVECLFVRHRGMTRQHRLKVIWGWIKTDAIDFADFERLLDLVNAPPEVGGST